MASAATACPSSPVTHPSPGRPLSGHGLPNTINTRSVSKPVATSQLNSSALPATSTTSSAFSLASLPVHQHPGSPSPATIAPVAVAPPTSQPQSVPLPTPPATSLNSTPSSASESTQASPSPASTPYVPPYPPHLYRSRTQRIMIDPTDPVRRYQPNQRVQLKLSNGTWIAATITDISRASPSAATQTYTVEYVAGGRRECTSVGPSYLRPVS
ncbi:hypothetical protein DACRYDRAFT_90482 [Dacryopinax primogenitus]|uniref:Uncharacterized protein n=1 Tax=Dacryopinax primogenitus (strain DJM 731) TaxID=1858805 RepID=M5FQW6_DACPD|nr:uncharacterized protein DACRYDRAFT_90482 [Dacryopinax primogenitus]EJT99390.1 hypothetical protein DACRYDRAFT_90482 [Dacryopinax primogenitus]